jgi:glycosyltransferase involved in cell wall biosynthesis
VNDNTVDLAPLTGDLELERGILSGGGLFDEAYYVAQSGAPADPIGHYLITGWKLGLEPNPSFPGRFLLPYFTAAGFRAAPAVTWLLLKSLGWPVYDSRESAEAQAEAVRTSGFFDEVSYATRARLAGTALEPATHYVLVGERMGFKPSGLFDPAYYAARNPDVGAVNLLLHYAAHGLGEGRRPLPLPQPPTATNAERFDPARENVLLVINNASRTGAPILAWNIGVHLARRYNVFTVLIGTGDLQADFASLSAELYGPCVPHGAAWDGVTPIDFEHALSPVLEKRKFKYAIVNSSESCTLIEPCMRHFIATLFLVHEFAVYVGHFALSDYLRDALNTASEVIFPASLVAKNSAEYFMDLAHRRVQIRPQGLSQLPGMHEPLRENQAQELGALQERVAREDPFVVIGAGWVHFMKGVDLFLAIAAAVKRAESARRIHFVWVGQGFGLHGESQYADFLREQVKRSGLIDEVTFLGELTDLDPLYDLADAFLLSSRLDPLPNVSIEAAVRGLPVVCFQDASGIAEILGSGPETARSVVEHLDTQAAADLILQLANDEGKCEELASATRRLAHDVFDMEAYVASLDVLGAAASQRAEQQQLDLNLLLSDDAFDQDTFLGPYEIVESRRESIVRYLAISAARQSNPDVQDWSIRRPAAGFNPNVYIQAHASTLGNVNALADFVRRGKPPGLWQAQLLRPPDPLAEGHAPGQLRAALHAHFFYPELAVDLLEKLSMNQMKCDLLISTSDQVKAQYINRILSKYRDGTVDVRVVPNCGRDIGPLLTEFARNVRQYDVVGHVHGKRSSWHDNKDVGEIWREFLWENLIGGRFAMLDRIMAQFEMQTQLGLVFPSDPHIIGWTKNLEVAAPVAERMGYGKPLPPAFDFPVGTMFWMRTAALRPLLDLGLKWDDYPAEPIPIDGTILHALERLLPLCAEVAGYGYAETHVPGVMR